MLLGVRSILVGMGAEGKESSQLVGSIISDFFFLHKIGDFNQGFKAINSVASLSLGKVYFLHP